MHRLGLLLLSTILACEKPEFVEDFPFPVVVTEGPTIDDNAVIVNTRLVSSGALGIERSELVWYDYLGQVVNDGDIPGGNVFSKPLDLSVGQTVSTNIDFGLRPGVVYYARTRLELSDGTEVYSDPVTWLNRNSIHQPWQNVITHIAALGISRSFPRGLETVNFYEREGDLFLFFEYRSKDFNPLADQRKALYRIDVENRAINKVNSTGLNPATWAGPVMTDETYEYYLDRTVSGCCSIPDELTAYRRNKVTGTLERLGTVEHPADYSRPGFVREGVGYYYSQGGLYSVELPSFSVGDRIPLELPGGSGNVLTTRIATHGNTVYQLVIRNPPPTGWLAEIYTLDLPSRKWNLLTNVSASLPQINVSDDPHFAVLDDRILLGFTVNSVVANRQLYAYDISRESWQFAGWLPFAGSYDGLPPVRLGTQAYFIGFAAQDYLAPTPISLFSFDPAFLPPP